MTYLRKPLRASTRNRIAGMRRLLGFLANGNTQRDQLRLKMHMSDSGLNKYLTDLTAGGIVEMMGRAPSKGKIPGQALFQLVADAEKIEAFFRAVAGIKPKEPRPMLVGPGRRFHILADDTQHAIRVHRGPVAPDPFALPAAFFRAASMEVRA